MTFRAFLQPSSGPPIQLEIGTNTIGRGNEYRITDRRVSRKHAEIILSQETGAVTITPLGMNPTLLQRGTNPVITLRKNEIAVLHHGDKICLIDQQYPSNMFSLVVERDDAESMVIGTQEGTQPLEGWDDTVQIQMAQGTLTPKRKKTVIPLHRTVTLSHPTPQVNSDIAQKKLRIFPVTPTKPALPVSEDDHTIPASELTSVRVLGQGSCGEVSEYAWRGTPVAVKKIFRSLLHKDVVHEFQVEAAMLRRLRHPNVVLFMGTATIERDMCIVTEYMSKGSLRDVLNSAAVLDPPLLLKMALDAATGLHYLHTYSPPIIHRDIKSGNFLVDEDYRVKVTDFGLARFTNANNSNNAMTFCGTLPWTAPEVLAGTGYSERADTFSFGILLWELFTRQEPYANLTQPQIIIGVGRENMRPVIPSQVEPEVARLMEQCWAQAPEARPTLGEVIARIKAIQQTCSLQASGSSTTSATSTLSVTSPPAPLSPILSDSPPKDSPKAHSQADDFWDIEYEELEFGEPLSRADPHGPSLWRNYAGTYRGQEVVLQVMHATATPDSPEGRALEAEFRKQIDVLKRVRSPVLLYFYGACVRPHPTIVVEYMPRGSLLDLMQGYPMDKPSTSSATTATTTSTTVTNTTTTTSTSSSTTSSVNNSTSSPDERTDHCNKCTDHKDKTGPLRTSRNSVRASRSRHHALVHEWQETGHWDWELTIRLGLETARALLVLHKWKPPVVHHDLRSNNVMLAEAHMVKIAGLGMGLSHSSVHGSPGACLYSAPELWCGEGEPGQAPTTQADIFSFGILLWELSQRCIEGKHVPPYANLDVKGTALHEQVARHDLRPAITPNTPLPLATLTRECWASNPDDRPTADKIVEELEDILDIYMEEKRRYMAQ
eukprot:TRINITY_DN5522_c0_g1_i1.p1 TRINITY_DN5522_c0_g1~~TRINITY_DN5522_c0_g1_i1.p1  ORF type:complete len:888 (-),score=262.81 TRINITY_DN5522_c0_g1_i1:24-2687(-)